MKDFVDRILCVAGFMSVGIAIIHLLWRVAAEFHWGWSFLIGFFIIYWLADVLKAMDENEKAAINGANKSWEYGYIAGKKAAEAELTPKV
jgi:hypothetical protein